MKTIVIGKETETTWSVNPNSHQDKQEDGTIKFVFDCKPELKSEISKETLVEVCEYDGDPKKSAFYNSLCLNYPKINIGDEEVMVIKEAFYGDLGIWKQFTTKIVSNTDIGKEDAEKRYNQLIRSYNKQIIEADERLTAYCNLHHLKPGDTDVEELMKIVYGNAIYNNTNWTATNTVYGNTVYGNTVYGNTTTTTTTTKDDITISSKFPYITTNTVTTC